MNRGSLSDHFWGIRCVWLRYFDVFRKNIYYATLTTFLEPILYLLSFGYGLAALIGPMQVEGQTVKYRQFVFAGIVAQAVLFQGFFEAAYGSFVRMYYQKIFKSMASTPVTLSEVLWGELIWDATKGTFGASAVLVIGVSTGDFSPWGALLAIPFCFLMTLMFASLGLWMSALSKNIEQLYYPQYLFIFPMFLFCGVYFPLEQLPQFARIVAWALPLTCVVSVVRTLTLGFRFHPITLPVLTFWGVGLVYLSRRAMQKRLVK